MMEPLIIIIMSCSAGLMITAVASAGIYYSFKSRRSKRRDMQQITSTPAHTYDEPYFEESVMDLERVPVQPETRRPIKISEDVYPPIKDEQQDDYLLRSLDMIDFSDDTVEKKGYLEITLHYYQLSSTLTVTLIRMGDLPIRDTGFPPDTLVEMQIMYAYDDKIKSEVYQCSCNPHMFESFRFEIPVSDLGNQTLFFKVIDMMETNLPPPPTPPEMPPSRWGKTPEPPPPPPPPSPTQIGVSTVPLVSVAMKKLLADTEITVVRDIIKLKRKPVPSARDSPLLYTAVSSTTDEITVEETVLEVFEVTEQEKEPEQPEAAAEVIVPAPLPTSESFKLDDEPPVTGASLLVSLAYWKPSEKLTIVVMKAKNLALIDKSKKPDPFVKLSMKMGDKKLKKKKTMTKKGDPNPVWNEAFSFAVPHRILHRISLHCSVKHSLDRGRERSLGLVILGSRSSEEDVVDHWNAMTTSSKSVAKWHLLEDQKPSSRRASWSVTRRGSKESPKGSKESPKGTKESPKGTKESTKRPKEGPKGSKEGPKGSKETGVLEEVPEETPRRSPREGHQEAPPPSPSEGAQENNDDGSSL